MAHDYGIGAGYTLSYSLALALIAFLAIAWYNVFELTIVIFTTFKRYSGLYFYSLLVATWGIVPVGMGFYLKFYQITSNSALYTTLIAIGWPMMVTGQSMVLYSRLNLIMHNTGRWVLYMIITDAIICHIPIIVLMYGTNCSPNPGIFVSLYTVYEKVQVSIFFVQEVVISGIYLYKTTKLLGSEGSIRGRNAKKVLTHLVWVNIIIIALDVTLLGLEYSGHYDIQTTYKAAVYSIKLKMEFSILNKLLDLFQGRIHDSSFDRQYSRAHASTGFGANRTAGKSNTVIGGLAVPSLGNSAYARMDDLSPIDPAYLKDMEVVKTTEVTIEHSDRASGRSISDDGVGSVKERTQHTDNVTRQSPRSSSEINIVSHAY